MATLTGLSAYVPQGRLPLAGLARQWGAGPTSGACAVAGYDEDALTLAAAAADRVLGEAPPDAVWFASTSAPYLEKQSATLLAAVVDAARDARTIDIGASLRGWTGALTAAADAVAAGSATRALVAAGEVRPAAPDSVEEQTFGDAGGAALVEAAGDGAELMASATVSDTTMTTWRRATDRFVRHGEQRFAMRTGELAPGLEAADAALRRAGVEADDLDLLVVAASTPRVAADLAKRLGTGARVVTTSDVAVGHAGTAHPALLLTAALAEAAPGQTVLLIATGDGADAILLRAGQPPRGIEALAQELARAREVSSYASVLRRRGVLPLETTAPRSSPVAQRREEGQTLRLHAMRCQSCGLVQYPVTELCSACASADVAEQPMARTGTIHTYTTDHIVAGINPGIGESPVTLAVVDLDDGARAFLQLTDHPADDVAVGDRVELCFRLLHDGSEYHNYYWKARPATRTED